MALLAVLFASYKLRRVASLCLEQSQLLLAIAMSWWHDMRDAEKNECPKE